MKTTITRTLAIGAIALAFVATQALGGGSYGKAPIFTLAQKEGFNTLSKAIETAKLQKTLTGEGPFTVFAPTDEAFSKLPKGTVESLLKPENRDKLVAILTYHVVEGEVMAADVGKLEAATTLNGQRIDIKAAGGKVGIDNATVIKADVEASNGVIHVIDTVLLPVDESIVGVASKAGHFKTLLAAAKAAGLADALSGEGPLTVFAPTDEAFAKLPEGTVESLLQEENLDKLRAILKYHVVQGRAFSDEALKKGELKTLQGANLSVSVKAGKAQVNEAGLVSADIDAANGVIHVIDHVLLPPEGQTSDASYGCTHQGGKRTGVTI